MDTKDQNLTALHYFCVEEEGTVWFDHGAPCERPDVHEEIDGLVLMGRLMNALAALRKEE